MKKIIIIFLFILSSNLFAQNFSMRRCVLLPITDDLNGAMSFQIFQSIERYVKEVSWCKYQSNSNLINIFANYRNKLNEHLQNEKVLRVVAERMKSGSLIRIHLKNDAKGVEVQVKVIGENGRDVYFLEKAVLNPEENEVIIQTIKNWLKLYEATIPYDGLVVGVLGDQITIDLGKNYKVQIGQEYTVRRLAVKRKHPLLKTVVSFDTEKIADGKIFNVSRNQSLGMMKRYMNDGKVKSGDWVKLEPLGISSQFEKTRYPEIKKNSFGKLGFLRLTADLSSAQVSTKLSERKKVGANIWGFSARSEAWITREYIAIGEFNRRFGTLKNITGNTEADTVETVNTSWKLAAGYRYLPLGFFNGPQIDGYAGYASYRHSLEEESSDGHSDNKLSGFVIGGQGILPLQREIQFYGRAELLPFPTFEDEDEIYGEQKSASSMQMEIGAKYKFNDILDFVLSYELTNNKIKFKTKSIDEVTYRDNTLKLGVQFIY